MVMAVREEHPKKAPTPIVVTPSGMVMAVREEHPQKVSSAIDVTPSINVTSVRALLSLKLPVSSVPWYTAVWGILGEGQVPGLRGSFHPSIR
jgi:hypothetical protein